MNANHTLTVLSQNWFAEPLTPTKQTRADKFRAQSMLEHAMRMLEPAPQLMPAAKAFFDNHGDLLRQIEEHPLAARLANVRAWGYHSNQSPGFVYKHTRLEHSRGVAAAALVLSLHIGRNELDTLTAVVGALLHDIGHPAGGHDADDALVEYHGLNSHEQRGCRLVTENRRLHSLFHRHGLAVTGVVDVMAERGGLGPSQSLVDTLAYLELDAIMLGMEVPEDFVWRVVSVIREVREDRLVVSNPEPVRDMLCLRARLYQEVYRSMRANVTRAAFAAVLRYAIRRTSVLTATEVAHGTDDMLDERLERLCSGEFGGVPDWVSSAWRITLGHESELAHWRPRLFDREDSFYNRRNRAFAEGAPLLAVTPHESADKTLRVEGPDGFEEVRGKIDIHDINTYWFIFTFCG